jgi:hypothetical protein
MADAADMTTPDDAGRRPPDTSIAFRGSPRNMAVGITMLLAGILAFVMGMTDVFFAEAMAWVFIIWGALFLFGDLLDYLAVWRVTDNALVMRSPSRIWRRSKVWEWENVHRLDLVVKRIDPKVEDVVMQVYYTAPGDSVLEREDRMYSEELTRLIIERAKLKPTHAENPASFGEVPSAKATYVWNRSGRMVTS